MVSISLEDIPGIGPKLRERILGYFKSEEESIRALKNGMGSLVPGISAKKGVAIAKSIFRLETGADLSDVLRTEHAFELYNDIIGFISEYLISEYSKNKILLLFPLGPDNIDIIRERYDKYGKALKLAEKYGDFLEKKGLHKLLTGLSTLKKEGSARKIKNRCVLTDDPDVMETLRDIGAASVLKCILYNSEEIGDPTEYFGEFAESYDVVIVITGDSSSVPEADNIVLLDPSEVSEELIIPERVIGVFSSNKKIIDAITGIIELLEEIPERDLYGEFLEYVDKDLIATLRKSTEILEESGEITAGYDEKLDLYRSVAGKFAGIIVDIENRINDLIRSEINKSSVTISGEHILDLLRADATVEEIRQYIPPEIDMIIGEAIDKGLEWVEEELGLGKSERELLEGLKPEYIEIPISLNPEGVNRLQSFIIKRASVYNHHLLVKIATELRKKEPILNEVIWAMLEFEMFYAIGRFARDYGLRIPRITDGKKRGIAVKGGYNLYLMNSTLKKGTETVPIDYCIGDLTVGDATPGRLIMLSGSNSGGKTMCLLTVAHCMIMAQMGLPCPGDVVYYPFSELYFFKKSSGQLSAGAFEDTLLKFVRLARSPKYKLVLADELEAITEPNAAARVISAIFSLLLENPNNYAVFVTHLVDLLLENLDEKDKRSIRIDGIEATGLNDRLELIINRSPRFNFIAKSTPEFILERLSKSGDPENRAFFKRVLEKFRS